MAKTAISVGGEQSSATVPGELIEIVERRRDVSLKALLRIVREPAREILKGQKEKVSPLELPEWVGFSRSSIGTDVLAGIDTSPSLMGDPFKFTFPPILFGGGTLRTPPYDWSWSSPTGEETHNGGVVRSAGADVTSGRLALEALVWAGTTGTDRENNSVVRSAHAGVGAFFAVPPAYAGSTLRLYVVVRCVGSALVSGGFFEPAQGGGFAQLSVSLHALAGATAVGDTQHWCHVAASPPSIQSSNMNIVKQASPEFLFKLEVTPDVPNRPLLAAVDATLRVGVSDPSNVFTAGNFSPLTNWAQPAGSIEVPYMFLTRF